MFRTWPSRRLCACVAPVTQPASRRRHQIDHGGGDILGQTEAPQWDFALGQLRPLRIAATPSVIGGFDKAGRDQMLTVMPRDADLLRQRFGQADHARPWRRRSSLGRHCRCTPTTLPMLMIRPDLRRSMNFSAARGSAGMAPPDQHPALSTANPRRFIRSAKPCRLVKPSIVDQDFQRSPAAASASPISAWCRGRHRDKSAGQQCSTRSPRLRRAASRGRRPAWCRKVPRWRPAHATTRAISAPIPPDAARYQSRPCRSRSEHAASKERGWRNAAWLFRSTGF